jgi:hypothetical protein
MGTKNAPFADPGPTPPSGGVPMSALGFVLFDEATFKNNGSIDDSQFTGVGYAAGEQGEESWIDENSTPILVNRYNGTLIRAE